MEETKGTMEKESNRIFLDAPIIGGALMAVLSVMPIINLFNLLCCMWLIVGGIVSYVYASKKEEYVPRATDGLIYGVLSGIFGWIFALVLGFLLLIVRVEKFNIIRERLNQIGGPEAEKIAQFINHLGVFGFFFIFNLVFLVFYLIFPTIGGAVAQSFTKKRPDYIKKTEENNDKLQN